MSTGNRGQEEITQCEVTASEANDVVRTIYGEMMHLCQVPLVTQVFRRLASVETELMTCWQILQPLLRDGAIQTESQSLVDDVLAQAPVLTPDVLMSVGLDDTHISGIRLVLDAYNRANAINLLCVRVLLDAGATSQRLALPANGPWRPKPLSALPETIDAASLPAHLQRLLQNVSSAVNPDSSIAPGMYRHLMHWPQFLGLTAVLLHSNVSAIRTATTRVEAHAKGLVEDWIHASSSGPVHRPQALNKQSRDLLREFSPRISEMLVVGNLLHGSLGEREYSV